MTAKGIWSFLDFPQAPVAGPAWSDALVAGRVLASSILHFLVDIEIDGQNMLEGLRWGVHGEVRCLQALVVLGDRRDAHVYAELSL